MAAKVTMVKLVVPNLGWEKEFTCTHAEKLLSMKNNGGWALPEDSPYEYANGSISRINKKGNKGKTE